jgi:hypothetical protein
MARMKLFSQRRKLFSEEYNEGGMTLRQVVCRDCGHVMETAENVSQILCPNCGGRRFNLKLFKEKLNPETEKHEDSLNEFETKLKEFSGKTVTKDIFEKTFSNKADDMLEKGFASIVDNDVVISPTAFEQERLFSKLIIQVTKVLDLDEDVVSGDREFKSDLIDRLDDRRMLPEKGIMILKKAHDITPRELHFSEDCCSDWVSDSSIIPDLKLEYANQSMGIKQFMDILRNRYPDAPEDIIDQLISRDVIFLDGSQVTIKK